MDSPIIEVAIALIFVALLASLATTALQEAFTSWRGTRGKILRRAIESFVGDDPRFAQQLMGHPLLVSLSPQEHDKHDERRPSYIGADTLVAALMEQLVQKAFGGIRPQSPIELVDGLRHASDRALGTGALPGAAFAGGLAALVRGVEQDWPAFEARVAAWYEAVGERASGWFKREVQHTVFAFGLAIAALFNINPIVISSRLWEDEPLRKAMVTAAQKYYDAQTQAPQPAAVPAPAPAPNSSPAASSPMLQTAMDDFSDRLIADITASELTEPIKLILRDVLTPTIDLAHDAATWQAKPAKDRDGTLFALENAMAKVPKPPEHQQLHASFDRLKAALVAPAPAVPSSGPSPSQGESTASDAPSPLACESIQDEATSKLCLQVKELESLKSAGIPIGWGSDAAWPRLFGVPCEPGETRRADCAQAWPARIGNWALMPLGWLLVALACTLGAPFWFDLLGRVIRLRGSGDKPAPVQTDTTTGEVKNAGVLIRSPSPAPAADASATPDRPPMSDALNDAERALGVLEVQRLQRSLGLNGPEITGFFDGATRRAIQDWHKRMGAISPSAELSQGEIQQLMAMNKGSDEDGYLG